MIDDYKLEDYFDMANSYAALTTTKPGALGAMVDYDEFMKFRKSK